MPMYQTINDEGEDVERYRWPAQYITPTRQLNEILRSLRKQAVKDREEFIGYQKACGEAKDREGARFFKECANIEMRMQRACSLMIPYFGEPDSGHSDLDLKPTTLWPGDLAHELDAVSRALYLA